MLQLLCILRKFNNNEYFVLSYKVNLSCKVNPGIIYSYCCFLVSYCTFWSSISQPFYPCITLKVNYMSQRTPTQKIYTSFSYFFHCSSCVSYVTWPPGEFRNGAKLPASGLYGNICFVRWCNYSKLKCRKGEHYCINFSHSFFAELLGSFCRTLEFQGTPVEKFCSGDYTGNNAWVFYYIRSVRVSTHLWQSS